MGHHMSLLCVNGQGKGEEASHPGPIDPRSERLDALKASDIGTCRPSVVLGWLSWSSPAYPSTAGVKFLGSTVGDKLGAFWTSSCAA